MNSGVSTPKIRDEKKIKFLTALFPILLLVFTISGDGEPPKAPDGMVLIPAGEFQMGSHDAEADTSEKPLHTVYVDAFYMDVHEVTNAEFKAFVDANPDWQKEAVDAKNHYIATYFPSWEGDSIQANEPVTGVNWHAAMAYAKWAGKRLPTEAEWERAARGGLEGKKYPWGDEPNFDMANYGQRFGSPKSAGTYPANAYGLYDMSGNVWEWVLDAYEEDFYANSPRRNPVAGGSIKDIIDNFTTVENRRVMRGGAYDTDWDANTEPIHVRVYSRSSYDALHSDYTFGFRCVKPVKP